MGAVRVIGHLTQERARFGLVMLAVSIGTMLGSTLSSADEQTDSLIKSYNRLGFDLFEQLTGRPGNLVFSPYSVGTAMAMALSGARGETQAQMAHVLKQDLSAAAIADANQRLTALVTKRAPQEDTKIAVANALHLTTHGAVVAESYKRLLADKFDAELFSGSDLAAINNWVMQKTDGKIVEILERLDPNSVCVLLDAIHFMGPWAHPFNKRSTAPGPFRYSTGETFDVPMMRQTGTYRILRAHTFDAIALPYSGNRLSMIILLPMRHAGPGEAAISLTDKTIEAVLTGIRGTSPEPVRLSMPKFKTELAANLVPVFESLGMTLAFDENRADFSGITESTKEEDRVHISQAQHKTFIDVNEDGTEAAAATAVEIAKRAVPPPSTSIEVDRPFLYLIADETAGLVLFIGRMSDPRI